MKESVWKHAEHTFSIESSALMQALACIDKAAFEKAVAVLAKAGRIGASGCGHSGIACRRNCGHGGDEL